MTITNTTANNAIKKLLIVDDDAAIRHLVSKLFSNPKEYEVSVAEDGVKALTMLSSWTPDVIICDIMMPNMDGFELFINLKQDERLSVVPFLFISANSSNEDTIMGFGLGADDYITKPFHASDFIARIEEVLARGSTPSYDVNHPFKLYTSLVKDSIKEILRLLDVAYGFRNTLLGLEQTAAKPGMLVIEDKNRNSVGAIYISNGRVLNAVIEGQWGEESLFRIMDVSEGYLKYYPAFTNITPTPSVNKPITEVLQSVGYTKS